LLGETISENKYDDLKAISKKLEIINYQLSQQQKLRRKRKQILLISLIIIFTVLFLLKSPYLNWDYSNP